MTDLYLIRHGQATTQLGEQLKDYGLTALGMAQAEQLSYRLAATKEIAADVLIASTLPRARQTAEIIASALELPILFDDEFQELRVGDAEELSVAEFREKFGGYRFENEPFRPVSPGGENWGQFVLRASTALDRVIHQYEGKTIVVVCHGGIVDSSFLYFLGMNTLALPETRFDTYNTSITQWSRKSVFNRPPRWRLVRYNDALHLRALSAPEPIPWEYLAPKSHEIGRTSAEARTPTVTPTEQ